MEYEKINKLPMLDINFNDDYKELNLTNSFFEQTVFKQIVAKDDIEKKKL